MATNGKPESTVVIARSVIQRDLRISQALLVAGVSVLAAYFAMEFTGVLNTASTSSTLLSMGIGEAGMGMTFVGALFGVINWSLLRRPQPARVLSVA